MQKGLVGVVHAFAERDMSGANDIVLAHELLHTVGATDKYDLASGVPLYPSGYADPDRNPLYPQAEAEIMAGRRALSAQRFEMPPSLASVVVGPETAREIRWTRPMTDWQRTAHGLAARAVSVCAGTRELVRELSIGFAAGEMLAILGRNGSGKTLTLHTLRRAARHPPAGGGALPLTASRSQQLSSAARWRNDSDFCPRIFEEPLSPPRSRAY